MSSRVEDLEPITREMCRAFMDEVLTAGHLIRVTWTLRTNDEQAHLYAKGRDIPGEPCHHGDGKRAVGTCAQHPLGATATNARPGESPHNEVVGGRAAAFDICFAGLDPYAESHPWEAVGAIGKACGLVWGGDFVHLKDRPHFERPDWRDVRGAV